MLLLLSRLSGIQTVKGEVSTSMIIWRCLQETDMLDRLRDATERQEGTPGFLVLLPADQQTNMPIIDGTPLPVVLASQWARLTETWIANEHRGAIQIGRSTDHRVGTS